MTLKLMGRKQGMTRLFTDKGDLVVCTVITTEPNVVTQLKTKEKDGYEAVQLSAEKVQQSKLRNVTKPLEGHFRKAGVDPRRRIVESRVDQASSYQIGQEIGVDYFADSAYVDVSGISKGKGYQGVMKRHGYAGGPASHGSGFHRHAGSTGMRSSPGRCLPGVKKAGHMGSENVTVQSLKVVKIDAEKHVLVVQGAIPGAQGSPVYIAKAKKKATQTKK